MMPDARSPALTDELVLQWRTCPDEKLLAQCRWEAFRASGPGGQKRNKTSSAIRITHEPTGISGIANESRSQAGNRESALRRLRHRMTLDLRTSLDPATFARPAWFATLLGKSGRLELSLRHEFYLATAGLLLDVLAACGWSVSDAAQRVGLTTSNFVRFLQADEPMLAIVNAARGTVGLRPLGARE